MKDVVVHLAEHLDAFALEKNPEYSANTLYNAMKTSEKAKGRLLYYFPLPPSNSSDEALTEDSWIGWHNDSGFLTALAGDMYVNDETGPEIAPPDPDAGLYVMDHQDSIVHVTIPLDCMAVQVSECVQILMGGNIVATPHCVQGAKGDVVFPLRESVFSLICYPTFPCSLVHAATRLYARTSLVGWCR